MTRRLLVDIRPLRESSAFRRLWIGGGLSGMGSQMTVFAVAFQVFTLTHSSFAVGAVGLATALPAIMLGLFGGSVADAVDRRRLCMAMTSIQAVISMAFAAQAFAGIDQVWLLYVLVALSSIVGSVNAPARRTFLARLLPPERRSTCWPDTPASRSGRRSPASSLAPGVSRSVTSSTRSASARRSTASVGCRRCPRRPARRDRASPPSPRGYAS